MIIRHKETIENGEFTDSRDGKKYKTVKIGEHTWMAENLNYEAESSKCYDNDPAYCETYGRLYNWPTAMKVCPEGWHLPSNEEWDALYHSADGTSISGDSPYESDVAGELLKSKSGWNEYKDNPGNGYDNYGFSALPGGSGNSNGEFNDIGYLGSWWSSSEYDKENAYGREIDYKDTYASWDYFDKAKSFFSIRCVKNK